MIIRSEKKNNGGRHCGEIGYQLSDTIITSCGKKKFPACLIHTISKAKNPLWRQFIQLHLTVSSIILDIIFSSVRCFQPQ